jgi:hypothetical protein
MTVYIAKWLDHATRDCLFDDGIRDFTTADLINLPAVSLVRSDDELAALQRGIEAELTTQHEPDESFVFNWTRSGNTLSLNDGDDALAVLELTEVTL